LNSLGSSMPSVAHPAMDVCQAQVCGLQRHGAARFVSTESGPRAGSGRYLVKVLSASIFVREIGEARTLGFDHSI
jgi:hypothetical protein